MSIEDLQTDVRAPHPARLEPERAPERAGELPGGELPGIAFSDQDESPYLEALQDYADADVGRLHVPGHKGGAGAGAGLVEALGERALRLDVPAVTHGIDVGPKPTPLQRAETLAADLWGAKRTWFLTGGASQGNHAVCMALAQRGSTVLVQRNVHSSTVSGLVMSGLRPFFLAPEVDRELGMAHCITPQSLASDLDATPEAVAVIVVSPTYYGAVGDVRELVAVCHARGVPLVVDEAWGAHLAFHEALPEHALAAGADVVISGTHKIVGSLTQSAMLHVGWGAERFLDEEALARSLALFTSTSPSALLIGSLDASRRHAAMHGRALLEGTIEAIGTTRATLKRLPDLRVLDEGIVGRPGVWDYDPLRLVVDVRATGVSGFEIARHLRERSRIFLEFMEEGLVVALFGLGGSARAEGARLAEGLRLAATELAGSGRRARRHRAFTPPPRWGPLDLAPREAFLAPHETVPVEAAVGRVAAEALAVYPPGIANVLPGERLTASTLVYLRRVSEQGGRVRGASDSMLRTIRVVSEA